MERNKNREEKRNEFNWVITTMCFAFVMMALSLLIIQIGVLAVSMRTLLYIEPWMEIAFVLVLTAVGVLLKWVLDKKRAKANKGTDINTQKTIVILLICMVVLLAATLALVPKAEERANTIHNYFPEGKTYEPFTFTYSADGAEYSVTDKDGTSDGEPLACSMQMLDSIPPETIEKLYEAGYTISIDSLKLAEYSYEEKESDVLYQWLASEDDTKEILFSHCTAPGGEWVESLKAYADKL